MIPQVEDDLREDFTIETMPNTTFRMNHEAFTIIGMIDGLQAVEQSVFLILNIERYQWLIFSWNYGVELHSLIGKPIDFVLPESERRIREALMQDDRITDLQNFEFEVTKKKVHITFRVISIYGEFDAETEVEL